MKHLLKNQVTMFVVMIIVGMLFNPMNILAYRLSDLYTSLTLLYSGLLMASNMIWAHEIVHYLRVKHFNVTIFFAGICLSIFISILLRKQIYVNDKQWLKRMVGHHSTALTTSHQILNKTNDIRIQKLAREIISTQEKEIEQMKIML